jgi:hypothetical protein
MNVMARIAGGMLMIGNTKPDNIIVQNDATASWNATCCESARVEIISQDPALREIQRQGRISRIQEPFTGSPKSPIDASTIATDVASEMAIYGSVLVVILPPVPSGAIRTCSIVPRSFSRTTEGTSR